MFSDNSFEKDLKHYKREIKSKLLCNTKESKACYKSLCNDIDNYIADNEVISIDAIYNHFGTADEIANAFFFNVDIKTVKSKIGIKKLVAVLVVAIVVIWAIVAVVDFKDSNSAQGAYEVHNNVSNEITSENILSEDLI